MIRHMLCGAAAAVIATALHASPLTGAELIEKSDRALKSDTEVAQYRMEIVASDGEVEQSREFIAYIRRDGKEERTLQKFTSPPVYQGTGLLIVDQDKAENDIWFYQPSSRRIRRIAGQERSNRYMGTEFSYEDFEDYRIDHYDFTLIDERPCEVVPGDCHVIEATPATPTEKKASGYARKVYWLEKNSLYPVQIELFDRKGKPSKQLLSEELHQTSGYWRPRRQVMTNLQNRRATRLFIESLTINESVDTFYVSQRFLRR